MTYESELLFFRKILHQLHISSHVSGADAALLRQADMGLRNTLGLGDKIYRDWAEMIRNAVKDNVIYKLTDEFFCSYVALLLPEEPQKTVLIIGPYVTELVDRSWIQDFVRKHSIHESWISLLEDYFRQVPRLGNDDTLNAALNTLAERLWGPQQFTTETIIGGVPESWMPLTEPDPDADERRLNDIHAIEQRYEFENQLMRAVSTGRSHLVRQMLSGFTQTGLQQRAADPSRNAKNYTVILNTILRKAAENGGVHPLYIDRLSSDFALRIEAAVSWKELQDIWEEMAHKYCLLVKKHSMRDYSPLVQKVMARVDFDLTTDLSLKANAEALSVNPSYLSTLFKKETGVTLTDYVNRKRVEHAAYLLSSTDLSVSSVGQRCGIQDDNYFTKIFKKYTEKTPKQYRHELRHFPGEEKR